MVFDGQKAALRTAYQNVQAALCLASLAFVSSAIGWLSGADIDLFGAVATLRAAIGAALLAAVASVRSYYMNRDGKGDPSVSACSIADALTANGTPITSNPIRTWRKRNVAG